MTNKYSYFHFQDHTSVHIDFTVQSSQHRHGEHFSQPIGKKTITPLVLGYLNKYLLWLSIATTTGFHVSIFSRSSRPVTHLQPKLH